MKGLSEEMSCRLGTLTDEMASVFGMVIFGPPRYNLADIADAIGVAERGVAAMHALYRERIHELNIDATPTKQEIAAGAPEPARAPRKRGRKPRVTTNGEAPATPSAPLFPETAA